MMGFSVLFAQQKVTGRVTAAEDGAPLAYVTVIATGTSVTTQSNEDGEYSINVPAGATSLTFSFVGMQTVTVALEGRILVNVEMSTDAVALEDVIVVAYGVVRPEAKTGSVTSLSGEGISEAPVTSVDKMLAGKMAGVTITSSTGQPGSNSNIRIREHPLSMPEASPYGLWTVFLLCRETRVTLLTQATLSQPLTLMILSRLPS
jgi:hypothetical protein